MIYMYTSLLTMSVGVYVCVYVGGSGRPRGYCVCLFLCVCVSVHFCVFVCVYVCVNVCVGMFCVFVCE